MSWTSAESERVRTIEVKSDEVTRTVAEIDKKLDDLLALKNKGMGAFWLASIIVGAIFTGIISVVTDLFKG